MRGGVRAAVEGERQGLVRLGTALALLAGLALKRRGGGTIGARSRPTIGRATHAALLRALRPAESAARRLIAVLAHLAGPLAPVRPRPAPPPPDPKEAARLRFEAWRERMLAKRRPPPPDPAPRFRLTEAPEVPRPGYVEVRPRPSLHIGVIGVPDPVRPASPPPDPDVPVNAHAAFRRLAALRAALDDLPRQAVRMRRLQARLLRAGGREGALRPRRAPGTSRRRHRCPAQAILRRATRLDDQVRGGVERLDSS